MSTQSSTHRNIDWVPVVKPYTGTEDQPDNVSIFYKNGDQITIRDEALVNSMGHSPWETITALPRIEKAAKRSIEALRRGVSRKNEDLLNPIKNLVRAVIQLFPILGNGILIAYDYLRTHFYFHPKLKAELKDEDGPVMGVAFDGKIVAVFPPDLISDYDDPAAVIAYGWLSILQNEAEQRGTRTRLELAQDAIPDLFAQSRVFNTAD